MAKHALRQGQIDGMMGAAFMGYHLIQFTREALRGDQNASYYSAKKRTTPMAVDRATGSAGRAGRRVDHRDEPEHRSTRQPLSAINLFWRFRWPAATAIAFGN